MRSKHILPIAGIFLLAIYLSSFSACRKSSKKADGNQMAIKSAPVAPKHARIVIGGDLMQHIPQVNAAKRADGQGYDYSECFKYVKPLFEKADLAILNLETTLNNDGKYSGYPMFRSPAEVAVEMKRIGIDAAVLANNHILDGGKRGLLKTFDILDSVGIPHTGAFGSDMQKDKEHPLILHANDLTIALLNYTYGTNGIPVPDGIMVNMIDTFEIARDIADIDYEEVDAVIVFFHWGIEYARKQNQEQEKLANFCHDRGVEMVIGSHPHVVQPIEIEQNGEGMAESVTVYSLGNLVSNQRDRYKNGGIIVTLDITAQIGEPLSIGISYTPVWVQKPKYILIPPSKAETAPMTTEDKRQFKQFMDDTKHLLSNISIRP